MIYFSGVVKSSCAEGQQGSSYTWAATWAPQQNWAWTTEEPQRRTITRASGSITTHVSFLQQFRKFWGWAETEHQISFSSAVPLIGQPDPGQATLKMNLGSWGSHPATHQRGVYVDMSISGENKLLVTMCNRRVKTQNLLPAFKANNFSSPLNRLHTLSRT